MFFTDRTEAGRQLAARLTHLRRADVVVLGLPRGGVPVAAEVATALGVPLDISVVRKLGVPTQPELGMGAVGEGGVRVVNDEVLRVARVSAENVAAVEERERAEVERRARRYRAGRPRADLSGRTAVVVDDGIATGSTARAACQIVRAQGARRVVLAVPVAPHDWTARLPDVADEFVSVYTPRPFYAIGQFYVDFSQTTDEEVIECLRRVSGNDHSPASESGDGGDGHRERGGADTDVVVPSGGVRLTGHLTVPRDPVGIVVFAHGSGSSSRSPRNRFVASALHRSRLGTLLFDLLTPEEEKQENVFDIELLGGRLVDTTRWLRDQPVAGRLPMGYFGASTGAAAALLASTEPGIQIAAVVSRGGRPDLADARLAFVTAPTLLIIGGRDRRVLDLNQRAQKRLRCENRLAVVPGASHLFEEPGTLEAVADLARDWFTTQMRRVSRSAVGG